MNFNSDGLYISFLHSIKKQKHGNKSKQKNDNKCFHHALEFILNHEEMEKLSEKRTNIKPTTNKYKENE